MSVDLNKTTEWLKYTDNLLPVNMKFPDTKEYSKFSKSSLRGKKCCVYKIMTMFIFYIADSFQGFSTPEFISS